jgi:hypothetical protein
LETLNSFATPVCRGTIIPTKIADVLSFELPGKVMKKNIIGVVLFYETNYSFDKKQLSADRLTMDCDQPFYLIPQV